MDTVRLKRNIPLLYWLNGCHMFLVIMPVIVPYFQSIGLSMNDIYLLQAVFSGSVLLLELPSGYISDLLGRKNSLISACFFAGVGFTAIAFAPDFYTLCLAEVILAISVSLFSGTDISLLYDTLDALETKKAPIKIVGKRVFYRQSGETLAGLIGGWMVLHSLRTPVVWQAVIAWLPLILTFFLFEPPRKKMDSRKHMENIRYIFKSVFGHSRLLTLIVLNSMFYGVATLIAVWSFQHYWKEIGIPLHYFGYLWAATNATVAIVAKYAHKIEKYFGSFNSLVVMAWLPVIAYLGMGLTTAVWGAVFCLLFQICRGINSVILADGLNRRVSSDMRASANSVMALGVRILFIVFGPLAGFGIDRYGTSKTLLTLAGAYAVVFFVLMIPLLKQKENFAEIR